MLADHLRGAVAEDQFGAAVPGGDVVLGIQRHDRVGRILQDVGHEAVLCGQLVFEAPDFRQVAGHCQGADDLAGAVPDGGGREHSRNRAPGRRNKVDRIILQAAFFPQPLHQPARLGISTRIKRARCGGQWLRRGANPIIRRPLRCRTGSCPWRSVVMIASKETCSSSHPISLIDSRQRLMRLPRAAADGRRRFSP